MRLLHVLLLFTIVQYSFSQDILPTKLNGKWGYTTKSKEWIIKPKFEGVHNFSEGLAAVKKNGKWGFINSAGKWIVKPVYDEVGGFSNDFAAVKVGSLWGFVDHLGQVVIQPSFEKVLPFADGEANVTITGMLPKQKILIDKTGKQISPPYIFREKVENDVYHIVSQKAEKDSVYCYVNGQGELLTKWFLNDFKWGIKGQLVSVYANNDNDQEPIEVLSNRTEKRLFAFVNEKGEEISSWYEEIKPFKEGVAPAKKNHRYGFINSQYETIVDYQYLEIRELDATRYVAQTVNDGFVLINLKGEVIGKEYHGFDLFDEKYMVAYSMVDFMGRKTYRKALFTSDCKQVSGWYTEIYPRTNNYYRVLDEMVRYKQDGEVYHVEVYNYIVDSTGDVLSTWRPTSSMTWQTTDRKNKDSIYQFMHQPESKYYIEPMFFDDVFFMERERLEENGFVFKGGDYHDGMAMIAEKVSNNTVKKIVKGVEFESEDIRYGFIDWNGDYRIPCKYEYISGFSDGKAVFRQNGKFGAIDYKGKVVLPPKFDLLGNFGSGIAPFYADSAWGYVAVSGKTVIKPTYDEALPHRYGFAAVKSGKKWGLIDAGGNTVLDFTYRKPPMALSNKKAKVLIDGVGYEEINLFD